MSKQVDERVVEMRFDNKQFESATKETMSTLDKFKQKLQFKDATKGFDDIEKAAKKVDLNPLSKAAETVSMKFSAMQVAGVTAIANLTNSAVNASKNIAKALTITPVTTGFQEYETQINSVQTILANTESKGSTLQDVNAALNELNKYADLTIYNFTEMTRNIGTFTAAGVDLKTSVSAIKGIANLAAVSGSNSQQASTAMYQLSQALASGTVKLMDWNSVVNAGMGGQVFQDALKETARVHNIAIDNMIKKEGSFRETLQNGWLTSEILTETLSKFTGDLSAEQLKQMGYTEEQIAGIIKMGKTANDAATKVKTFTQLFDTLKEAAQSGWTKTWEILIGDFGEAKEFLTSISDSLGNIISKSADARNTMLAGGLSSGWKQLLNAGIADEEGYKEILKSVVTEHGVSIDEMIKAEQKLDDSLSDTEAFQKVLRKGIAEGTLTSDMFTDSVSRMADKMSNMSAEQLEAAGYTKDHVEQIKTLSEGLNDGSISMDEFVKKMGRSSGRENLIEALWNSFNGLLSVIKPIKEAFREIFPATTGEQLYSLTERIRDFTATLKLSDEQAANLKSAFKGVFSVINVGVTIIKSIIIGVATLIGKITGLSGGLLEISGSMGDWVSEMTKGITEANIFGKVIDGVVGLLGALIDKFKEFTVAVKEKVNAPGFEWFFNLMQGIWTIIQRIGSTIGKVAAEIGGAIATAFQNGDIKSLLDILNGGLFATILLGIKKYIKGITDKFDDTVGIVDKIKEVLGSVEESLKSWQQNLQSGTIKNIAIAIGILAASLLVISGIDSNKLASALTGIGVLMGELMGAMYLFTKITADAKKTLKGLPALIGIAAAVLILASALKKISDLSWNQLAIGLTGVLGLMAILVGAAKIMSKNSEKIKISAMKMVVMAVALKILSSVCEDLSKLSWGSLAKGVSGITAMLLAFAGFQALMKKIQPEKMLRSALSLVLIGAAIKLFSDACSEFGKMKWPDLGKAGAAISGILTIAAGFGKLSSYAGKMVSSSIALIMIGAAMKLFVDVVGKFGSMQWEELGKAGAAIGGILALATGFVLLSGLASGMIKSVISLTVMADAMDIFADVAGKFGEMDWEQLGKAGAAIGGILALAVGFVSLAGLSGGILTSAASLLVMAAALRVFTPVIMALGNMSWGEIAKGLITIAGAFAIVGIAGAVLGHLVGPILAVSGAIALLGIGCLAAGAGIMMFAAGFAALAAAGAAGATAFVSAITVIIIGILQLIPSIVNVLTDAIVAICNVIIQSAPAIGEAIKVLILTAIDVLVECIPALAEGLFKMVLGVLDALAEYTPQIVSKIFEILIGITESAAAALGSIDPETFLKGIAAMTGLMVALNLMGVLAIGAMKGVLAFGLVIAELAIVLAAIGALAQIPGLEWLISEGGDFLQKVGAAIGQFIGGIIGGIAEGATSMLPQVATNLSMFMTNLTPFIEGAKMLDESVLTNVQTLASIILALTGAGILDAVTSWLTGGSSITDFGQQLAAFGPFIKQFADSVAGIDVESVSAAANAGKMMAEMAKTLPNSGGIAGFFAGENDMGAFGSQLVTFGEGIADFSAAVDGKVSEGAVTAAVNAGTMISKLAASLPNSGGVAGFFAGNNDMDTFAKQLKKFGEGIAQFSESVSGKVSGVDSAVSSINKLISMLKNVSGVNADAIDSFKKSIKSLGKTSIDGFIESLNGANAKAKAAVTIFLNGISSAVTNGKVSVNTNFIATGSYLVDGFVKGITDNTFKAEAQARAMALKALDAAKKALDEHSPSKKFMKVGAFVVAGFANGIAKNVGEANAASVKMANGVLESTQDALEIHSPSVVFDKEVGRYIVQGIAEGIKNDTSAEEAAEKKAQNIVNAFKKELDKYDLDVETNNKQFDLWKLNEGKNASSIAVANKNIEVLTSNFKKLNSKTQLAHDEWQETARIFGEGSEKAQEALNKYLDSLIAVGNVSKEIESLEQSIFDSKISKRESSIEARNDDFELWKLNEGKNASTLRVIEKNIEVSTANFKDLQAKSEIQYAKWQDIARQKGEDSEEAISAMKEYRSILIEAGNLSADIKSQEESQYDNEIEEIENRKNSRDKDNELWELTAGRKASDRAKYLHNKRRLQDDINDAQQKVLIASDKYIYLLRTEGKNAEATKKAQDALKDANINLANATKAYDDNQTEELERRKETLKNQYELASDNADLRYQIWEKTLGREATDDEKNAKKLMLLSEQMASQAKLVQMADKEWRNATAENKQSKEKEYLSAQLELANLQSEVLDIQEENIKRQERVLDRQRNAQDEYADYVKKYEKYYLEHGMTKEELEKDARLVSGYDPNNAVKSMITKTSTALNNLKSNTQYDGLLSNFSNMGSSYATAVSEGIQNGTTVVMDTTSSMVKACVEKIDSEKESWTKAGVVLVTGFIDGIKSKTQIAANVAAELAARTLDAIKNAFANDGDYTPTITPVLDMSNVNSGVKQLTSTLTTPTSLRMARSIAAAKRTSSIGDTYSTQSDSPTVSFTQYNYSPKALSSVEIYRQTNNMISRIGKKVTQ